MRPSAFIAAATLTFVPVASLPAESIFNFETVSRGAALPLSMKSNGLTASVTGGGAVCSSAGLSGPMFTTLSGNALIQGLCKNAVTGPLTVTFSQPLSKLSFAFAINGADPLPVTITFREHGTVVATKVVNPIVPANTDSPEGAISYSGLFDSVSIASTGLLALDNLDAIPAQVLPTTPK